MPIWNQRSRSAVFLIRICQEKEDTTASIARKCVRLSCSWVTSTRNIRFQYLLGDILWLTMLSKHISRANCTKEGEEETGFFDVGICYVILGGARFLIDWSFSGSPSTPSARQNKQLGWAVMLFLPHPFSNHQTKLQAWKWSRQWEQEFLNLPYNSHNQASALIIYSTFYVGWLEWLQLL